MGDTEPEPADSEHEARDSVEASEPSPGERLRFRSQAFHRALDGVRELLDVVSPHLDDGATFFDSALEGMTSRQRRTALIYAIAIVYHPATTEGSDYEDDPFTDSEIEDADIEDTDQEEEVGEDDATDDLLPFLGRARAGDLPLDDLLALVEVEFVGVEARFNRFRRDVERLMFNPSKQLILNGSMLVTAVSIFESLLAGVLTEQFNMFPALVDATEPKFSLAELKEFETIEDAADAAIEAKVESLMHEDFEGWERWFQKRAAVSLSELSIDRLRLVEAIQRRHLIVHTGGRVTKKYLQRISAAEPHVGTGLRVTASYLERALDELDVLGLGLAMSLAYKWEPDNSKDTLNDLNVLAVELLVARRFRAAQKLCQIGCALEAPDSWIARALRVNEWIARKQLDGAHTIRLEIEAWDVSALAPEFSLAKSALLDDFDTAFAMLPKLIEDGAVPESALEEWPLLSELRADERYATLVASLKDASVSEEPTAAAQADDYVVSATEPDNASSSE